jgi:hypothetical protein
MKNHTAGCPGGYRHGHAKHRDRQHLRQGTARGIWCKRGRSIQAIGRSRGGWTTKVHELTDVIGRLYALIAAAGRLRRSLCDVSLSFLVGEAAKRTFRYDKDRYRARHLIENAFCRLKDFPPCRNQL